MSLRHSHHRRRRPSVEWHQTHKIDRLWIDDIFVRENLIVISCERYLAIYRTGWWVLMLGAHNLCADTMCLLHITRLSHSACVTVWHRSEINTTQFGGFGLDFFFISCSRSKGQTESIAIDTHQNGKCELVLRKANGKYVQTLFLECWECEWKRWQKGAPTDWAGLAGWFVDLFVCWLMVLSTVGLSVNHTFCVDPINV